MNKLLQAIAVVLSMALPGNAAGTYAKDFEILRTINDTCTITEYVGSRSDVVIPETIDGLTVTKIGAEAFRESEIVSVQFPDSIVSIGNYAFHYCDDLTELVLPEALQSIGTSAFGYCSNLQSVTMSDNVTDIESEAFIRCKSLQEIRLSASLTEIDDGVFRDCYHLQEVHLPDGIRRLGTYAFFGCRRLTSINLPEGLKQIEYRALNECEKLENVAVPESLEVLGPQAFYEYGNLTLHVVPGSFSERIVAGEAPHIVADLPPSGGEQEAPEETAAPIALELPNWTTTVREREQAADFIMEQKPLIGSPAVVQEKKETPSPEESAAPMQEAEEGTDPPQESATEVPPGPEDLLSLVKPGAAPARQTQTEQPSAAPTASALPAEAPLPSPDAAEDDESREWTGRAIGATGGTVEATVSVARGIIERCAIEDETRTEEMEAGYGLACSYVTGRATQEIEGLSKKDFMRRIRAYSEETGCKLSAGGEDADAALTAFLAIKDALAQP